MRRILALILTICIVLVGCVNGDKVDYSKYTKYSNMFFGAFDTVISVVSYQESEENFTEMMEFTESEFLRLNKLFDIYNTYDGINNIKTINDNAGVEPVKVEQEIIDLLLFSKEWYSKSNSKVNIAFGSVLEVWHDVRDEYEITGKATLPDYDYLKELSQYTDIDNVIIDIENSTVFLSDENMSLDVGAIAKGYATEVIAKELEERCDNFALSAGGNVRVFGKPMDGKRERWGVSIQNPAVDENYQMIGGSIDTAFVNNQIAVVCSGGYQRFFVQNNRRYHHLIDPTTFYPEEVYQGVAIIHPDSGVADALSTAVFFLAPDEALALINSTENAECVLTKIDGTNLYSDGADKYLQSLGMTNQTA